MTQQCMISNKSNVILVSDRAETLSDGKTYVGVQKIFEVSQKHSATIMLNGNPDFEDVPVKILNGEYVKNENFNEINYIKEIKENFINYVEKHTPKRTIDDYLKDKLKHFKMELNHEIKYSSYEKIIHF